MDSSKSLFLLLPCILAVLGLCYGAGVLPDGQLKGALGKSVSFTTTIGPPDLPFVTIAWVVNNSITIISTRPPPGSDTVGSGYKDRVFLNRSTGSLELRNLSLSDAGEYRLTITPAGGELLTGDTTLKVYQPVSNVVITPNNTYLVEFNSSVSLSCSSYGSSPFSYHWLNGSSEVTASDGVQLGDGGRTLTIANVTRYNQGPFMCTVSNPVNFDKQTLSLNISYGPENTRMKVTPPDLLYGSGSDLTLSCSAVSSPPAQFQWALNRTLLSNKGPELRLENIQASQSGSYSCWTHNTRTLRYQTSEPSNITVLEPISGANITTTPNPPIIEGRSVNLTCDAAGFNITREWMRDGQPLSSGDNIIFSENKKVLSINHVKRTDSGEYLCKLRNPISTADAKHGLIVNYGPDGMEIKGPTEIEVGQKFTLTCSADSIPTASYTWMLNGTAIPRHSPEFTKEKSEYSDSGDYTCTATNDVTGNKTAEVHKLAVKAEGSLTRGLSAGAITGIVIGVLMVVGVAVGVAVYFMKKKGFFKKESSSGRSVGNTGKSSVNGGNQDLNYADITQFQKREGGSVQLGNLGTSSTEYAQVRINNRPVSLPNQPPIKPTNPSMPALKPAPTIYSDVRRN